MYRSIDLFAGIGGIRKGFDNAFGENIETVFVSEWDLNAQKTYKANYNDEFEIAGDITQISEKEIPPFDICLAGFPCQAFSMAGKHMGFDDDYKGMCRGTLFQDVVRICEEHHPKVIFCENVKGLTIHDRGRTFKVIKKAFEQIGYTVYDKILNSKDFGVPQNRERIYIVCFRNDIDSSCFHFPTGNNPNTCIKDIMDKAPVPSKYYLSETYMNTLVRHRKRHEEKGHGFGYEIRDINGHAGTIVCGGMGRERNLIIDDRDHSMIPMTHIKGEINKDSIRKMTPREWARLQGFPENFKLKLADTHLYKQLGNSVTVNVIEEIAKEIRKVLEIMTEKASFNKGEWSELYAFIRLLKEGKIYAADEYVNRIDNVYFPIIKMIREETENEILDYNTGDIVRIYRNNELIDEIPVNEVAENSEVLFERIFEGGKNESGAFEIPEIKDFLGKMKIQKVKAPSLEKVDMTMQIHDINTGYSPVVGFSVKSDVGSPPTLLNAGKNTRIRYKVNGISQEQIQEVNSIDKTVEREYMKSRMGKLFELADSVEFDKVLNETFNENMIMIDSLLPEIFAEMVLMHYRTISEKIYDCEMLIQMLAEVNPVKYNRTENYRYKYKKMITASALGMTPGKEWNGLDTATGGYIIIKKDGDVLCYHLYNRNYFEEYLIKNTQFDRPSTSKFDYGYLYEENENTYIDLNVQVRFKSIKAGKEKDKINEKKKCELKRLRTYVKKLYKV